MGEVTHEQANLMLRLYEIRREARLRQARAWFAAEYQAGTPEEMTQKYPPGSEENASIRMVTSYWEMCASLVNRGLIDDALFFENNGEAWLVWERTKSVVPAWRAAMKNPLLFAHLEAMCQRMDAWREKHAPGATEAMRQMFERMAQMRVKAGAS
jgi:hypothetical protein